MAFLHSPIASQFFRFALVGVVATLVYALVYQALAEIYFPGRWASAAVPFAFVASLAAGYALNTSWSFRGLGDVHRPLALKLRYVLVQMIGFAINLAMTWIATVPLGLPVWTPLVPACLVTPLVTFGLQRYWVFA